MARIFAGDDRPNRSREVNVFNMPFVFRDEAHMRKVIDGPVGDESAGQSHQQPGKLVAFGWMDGGLRSLYTRRSRSKAGRREGRKDPRMMGNPLFDTMNAMGGNGNAWMAFMARSLQRIANRPGSMAPRTTIRVLRRPIAHNEVPKYYAQTNHLIIPEIFVMSKVSGTIVLG